MNLTKISAVFLLSFFFVFGAFADEKTTTYYLKQDELKKFYDEFFSENYYKKFPEIVKKDDPYYDSDVELSIAELKNKYPLDWIEKKFGKIQAQCCKDPKKGRKLNMCSEELVCELYSNFDNDYDEDHAYNFIKEVRLQDFNESELKSIFVNESKDPRAKDIIKIVYGYFYYYQIPSRPSIRITSQTDKKLRNFIFSPKIFFTSLRKIDSETLCNFSYNNPFLKSPYAEDLIFLLTFQKGLFEKTQENIEKYMYGGLIFDYYRPTKNQIFKIHTSSTTKFIECASTFSTKEKFELDQKFKDKFLTTKIH